MDEDGILSIVSNLKYCSQKITKVISNSSLFRILKLKPAFGYSTVFLLIGMLFVGLSVFASSATAAESGGAEHSEAFVQAFFWVAVILIVAKISSLVEKFGQPSVLGELVAGVVLGNLGLIGITFFEPLRTDTIIKFLSELGVVILLFQIGLESNIQQMQRVGFRASLVAVVGVVTPFVLGTYIVGPWLLPDLSDNAYLFLGAALTATSVGITARVFRDLGKLKSPEAQMVLGAAVIDDVLGLIILAVVSALVTIGTVSLGGIGVIVLKAIGFLGGAIVLGQLFAGRISRMFSKIHTGVGMKFTLALSFGLLFAYVANRLGLAPIVGAFAAGLILDPVHFKSFEEPEIAGKIEDAICEADEMTCQRVREVIKHHSDRHIEELIEPVAIMLVPIFFVYTGLNVDLSTLANTKVLLVALGITAVAFVGKLVSGFVAGNVRKSIVGWGMAPRGEVGLIFANIGYSLKVISSEVFSVIVIMVILTTLLTPPILTFILKQKPAGK